jgi:sulfite exporter TauE/SafE
MLSSIHPLGERSRHNKWWVTVTSFTIGAVLTAALIGTVFGWIGGVMADLTPRATLLAMGAVVLVAGLLDVTGVPVPGPERQVNENWIGNFRGWVYGGAYGVQLGAGLATYVVTWGVYAILILEFLSGSALAGAVIGGMFGAGRSVGLLLAGRIDRASRLSSFHKRMASAGPPFRFFASYGAVTIGLISIAGSWM